jgi:phosphatidylglycerophosphatase A
MRYRLVDIVHAKKKSIKVPSTWYGVLSTWFFVGKIPMAPGTMGAIAAYPIFVFLLKKSANLQQATTLLWISSIVLLIGGLIAVDKFQKETKTIDHSCVVIDEVVGQLLTLAISYPFLYKTMIWISPYTSYSSHTLAFVGALVTFRFYDIYKPLGIKSVETYLPNTFGVMLDDVLAAIYASATLYMFYGVMSFMNYLAV